MWFYDATKGWVSTTDTFTPNNGSPQFVAGAVDLKTGNFYFGGFSGQYFYLYKWIPSTGAFSNVGTVRMPVSGTANGDMAFDASGNLYIVQSSSKTIVYSVTSQSLSNANGGAITASPSNSDSVSLQNVNGMAFNTTGTIYVGNGSTAQEYDVSGSTGWSPVGEAISKLGTSTDLASCNSPANLTVQKNVGGRVSPDDQFRLSVKSGSTESANAVTTGSATGIQSEQIGPLPVHQGSTYTVSEGMASGSVNSMSSYESSLVCKSGNTTLTVTNGQVTIPNDSGATVNCVFTNSPVMATVNLRKRVQDTTGASSPGQGWSLGATIPSSSPAGASISPAGNQTTDSTGNTGQQVITFPKFAATADVTVSEEQQTGYDFASGSCAVKHLDSTTTTISLTSGSQTLSGIKPGDAVSCTFTNKQKAGTATWEKVSSDGATLLGRSTWTLTGPNVPASTVIQDCTSGSGTTCPAGAYMDQNPVPGQFSLTGLAWGSYTLTEKSAPDGYVLDATPHSFTISGASLGTTVTGSPFKNSPESALLTLVKKVTNTHGGTATPTDWTLTATGTGKTISGKTGDAAITTATVPLGTYTLTESNGPAGYDPSSWSCTGATVSNNSVTLAQGNSATCTITNSDRPGSVTWTKKDSSGSLLNGSEWTLTPPGAPAVTITDCTTSTCPTGDLKDQDPAPGKFKLTNLSWGSYTLTEAKAPMGYVLDTTSHTFTVGPDATKNQVGVPGPTSIGDFTNTQAKVPVLPLTGGTSADAFLIAGGAALAAAGLGGCWSRRRSHRADAH